MKMSFLISRDSKFLYQELEQMEIENAELDNKNNELEIEIAELKEELKLCQSVASEIVNKMKNCENCKYFTRKLLNCENIRICKINPNNIYGVCDIWELAENE